MTGDGGKRIVIKKTQSAFSKEERVGLYLVIGIGVLTFAMGGLYMGSHLKNAVAIEYDGPPVLTQAQKQEQALLELQTSDSDEDGITDYEELYISRTSPYLFDTDGDGVDDRTEIEQGTDPSCAPGEDCTNVLENVFEPGRNAAGDGFIEGALNTIESTSEQNLILEDLLNQFDAEQIRVFLIENGVPEEDIANYTDAQIIELYQTTIQQLEESGELDQILNESATQ
jgi:hypothetical protein